MASAQDNDRDESRAGKGTSVTSARLYNNTCGVAELGFFKNAGFISVAPVAKGKEGTYDRDTYDYNNKIFFQTDCGDASKILMALPIIEERRDAGKPAWVSLEHNGEKGSKKLTVGTDLETEDGSPSDICITLEEFDKNGDLVKSAACILAGDEKTKYFQMSSEDDTNEAEQYEINVEYETFKAWLEEAKRVSAGKAHLLSGGAPAESGGGQRSSGGDHIPAAARRRASPLPTTPGPGAKSSVPKAVSKAAIGEMFEDED
jgi:hypothetical protein